MPFNVPLILTDVASSAMDHGGGNEKAKKTRKGGASRSTSVGGTDRTRGHDLVEGWRRGQIGHMSPAYWLITTVL